MSDKTTVEVRMSLSSLGEGSETVGVNIPRGLHERIMQLCARDDAYRSAVIRACIMVGLPILEEYPGMASEFDPGGKDCLSHNGGE